jgi:hypothetical protein
MGGGHQGDGMLELRRLDDGVNALEIRREIQNYICGKVGG